jgi:hypothetical protein
MSKVVSYLKCSLTIFYFQFLEQGKAPFVAAKVWMIFNLFLNH